MTKKLILSLFTFWLGVSGTLTLPAMSLSAQLAANPITIAQAADPSTDAICADLKNKIENEQIPQTSNLLNDLTAGHSEGFLKNKDGQEYMLRIQHDYNFSYNNLTGIQNNLVLYAKNQCYTESSFNNDRSAFFDLVKKYNGLQNNLVNEAPDLNNWLWAKDVKTYVLPNLTYAMSQGVADCITLMANTSAALSYVEDQEAQYEPLLQQWLIGGQQIDQTAQAFDAYQKAYKSFEDNLKTLQAKGCDKDPKTSVAYHDLYDNIRSAIDKHTELQTKLGDRAQELQQVVVRTAENIAGLLESECGCLNLKNFNDVNFKGIMQSLLLPMCSLTCAIFFGIFELVDNVMIPYLATFFSETHTSSPPAQPGSLDSDLPSPPGTTNPSSPPTIPGTTPTPSFESTPGPV